MALTFGFVVDDWGVQGNVSANEWWPKLVMDYWGAQPSSAVYGSNIVTGVQVPQNDFGGNTKNLKFSAYSGAYSRIYGSSRNPVDVDVVFVQLGYDDLNTGSPDYTQYEADLKKIVNYMTDVKNSCVVLIDYWHGTSVADKTGTGYRAAEQCHNRIKSLIDRKAFNKPDMVSMTNLWLMALSNDDGSSPWFDGGDIGNKYGQTHIADVVIAGSVPVMKYLYNTGKISTPVVSYGVIGDSWAARDTGWDVRWHWTRIVGKNTGVHLLADAGFGGWTAEEIAGNSRKADYWTYTPLGFMDYMKPDFVFMVMGGNDLFGPIFSGQAPNINATAGYARTVIQKLINFGVKKILWSFYCQVNWPELGGDSTKNYFMQLDSAYKNIANQFSSVVTYDNSGLTNPYTNFALHKDSFYGHQWNSYDNIHLRDDGWKYLADGLTSSFKATATAYKNSLLAGPYLRIGSSKERLVSSVEKPRLCIGDMYTKSSLIH